MQVYYLVNVDCCKHVTGTTICFV